MKIHTNIYGYKLVTETDELKDWFKEMTKGEYLTRSAIAVVILHSSYFPEDGKKVNASFYDMFEDRSNQALISERVLPKLIKLGYIEKGGIRTPRYYLSSGQ